MTATLIDGKAIAARMRDETRAEAEALAEAGWAPKLVSISVGDVAAAVADEGGRRAADRGGMGKADPVPDAVVLGVADGRPGRTHRVNAPISGSAQARGI